VKRAGQVAKETNTVLTQRAAVIEVASARRVWVEENTFVNCGPAQLGASTPPTTAVYIAAEGAQSVSLVANHAFESVRTESSVPSFDCKAARTHSSRCEGNDVVVGSNVPATPPPPTWPDRSVVSGFACVVKSDVPR
jgi:hypothetical protein